MIEISINKVVEFEEMYNSKYKEKLRIKSIKWNDYLLEYKKDNPNLEYKEMLNKCSIKYRKLKALIL
jgi:hypothetical protein